MGERPTPRRVVASRPSLPAAHHQRCRCEQTQRHWARMDRGIGDGEMRGDGEKGWGDEALDKER